jgi:hypothetical protein
MSIVGSVVAGLLLYAVAQLWESHKANVTTLTELKTKVGMMQDQIRDLSRFVFGSDQ